MQVIKNTVQHSLRTKLLKRILPQNYINRAALAQVCFPNLHNPNPK